MGMASASQRRGNTAPSPGSRAVHLEMRPVGAFGSVLLSYVQRFARKNPVTVIPKDSPPEQAQNEENLMREVCRLIQFSSAWKTTLSRRCMVVIYKALSFGEWPA